MESKKWMWVVIACLAVAVVYQIAKLSGDDSPEASPPQTEQAVEPDYTPVQTASLGELTGMLTESEPQAIQPAETVPTP